MPRGNLYTPGEKARRTTIRMREEEWTLFENEADEAYRTWQEHVQFLVNEQIRAWRWAAWKRAHPEATADDWYAYGKSEVRA